MSVRGWKRDEKMDVFVTWVDWGTVDVPETGKYEENKWFLF